LRAALRPGLAAWLACALAACAPRQSEWDPAGPDDWIAAIDAAVARGDLARAESLSEDSAARFPDEPAILWTTAHVFTLMGRHEESVYLLRRIIAADDFSRLSPSEVHGWLGDLLFILGHYSESVPHLERAGPSLESRRRQALMAVAAGLPDQPKLEVPRTSLRAALGAFPKVQLGVGEATLSVVLDTGASWTVIADTRLADAGIGATFPAGLARDGAGTQFEVRFGVAPEVRAGATSFGPRPIAIMEAGRLLLRDPIEGGGEPIDGLLGLDLLGRLRLEWDPQYASVRLSAVTASPSGTRCVHVEGRLLAPVRIEGAEAWFLVDTGASNSSLTPDGLALVVDGARRARPAIRRTRSPGGPDVAVREIALRYLEAGGRSLGAVVLPVVIRDRFGPVPLHGVLGADVLLQRRFVLEAGRLAITS
jgi:hypothetical protein